MADALSEAIADARAERAGMQAQADKLLRQVELCNVRIAALEQAAHLRPLRSDSPRVRNEGGGSKGRQLGAISKVWRRVLTEMAASHPKGAEDADIAHIAQKEGLLNIRPRDVRTRMSSYESFGYVEQDIGGWRTTETAKARFGMDADSDDDQSDDEDDEISEESHPASSDPVW